MTSNKAQKTAIRQRMAATGEPYSVARKAIGAEDPDIGESPEDETPEEQYLREAEEAGVPAEELKALRAAWQARGRLGKLRRAAEQARERAGEAEEAAVHAEKRAVLAQEAAEMAHEWADEDDLRGATERADAMQQAAEQARDRADEAGEAAIEAEERAVEAEDLAARAGEWDDEAEEWDEMVEWDEDEADGPWHDSWPAMTRPPRPPRPLRLPRLPRLPRMPRFP